METVPNRARRLVVLGLMPTAFWTTLCDAFTPIKPVRPMPNRMPGIAPMPHRGPGTAEQTKQTLGFRSLRPGDREHPFTLGLRQQKPATAAPAPPEPPPSVWYAPGGMYVPQQELARVQRVGQIYRESVSPVRLVDASAATTQEQRDNSEQLMVRVLHGALERSLSRMESRPAGAPVDAAAARSKLLEALRTSGSPGSGAIGSGSWAQLLERDFGAEPFKVTVKEPSWFKWWDKSVAVRVDPTSLVASSASVDTGAFFKAAA